MDFKYPPEAEKFRQEIRAWLEANAPKGDHPPYDTITVENDEEWEQRKVWYRKLHSGGWIGISWPRDYGGRDADVMQALVHRLLTKRGIAGPVGLNDDLAACGLSSLDTVNLMLAVEAEFDVKIPDRDMTPANFRSVVRIEALVEKLKPGA